MKKRRNPHAAGQWKTTCAEQELVSMILETCVLNEVHLYVGENSKNHKQVRKKKMAKGKEQY